MGQSPSHRSLLPFWTVGEATGQLSVDYVEASRLLPWLAASNAYPLAVLSYGASVPNQLACPIITLDLPQLEGSPTLEVWSSRNPVRTCHESGLSIAISGDMLAGFLQFDEEPGTDLDITTCLAYRRLLRQIRELGFPYLWRLWNYFPRINDDRSGLERYRQFCVGRHQTLTESLADFPASLPAGTAIGTASGPLQICFLAGVHSVTHFENPRQVNAYEYPPHYGPRSPSFARATLRRYDDGAQLFIAGTASVVGHASQHPGLPEEQTRETVNNLRALIEHVDHLIEKNGPGAPPRGIYKIYVRDAAQLFSIRNALRDPLLISSRLLFLQGELCRQELLVEIEGLITSDRP